MGTRHITAVFIGGEYKVAQYGQWDGYPSGQGATILGFLCSANLDHFKRRLKECRFGTEDEMKEIWRPYTNSDGWMTMEQSDRFKESRWGYLSRDTGAEILDHINQSAGEVILKDSIGFAGDSLMCEWVYVIDFDKNVLEVFQGFNTTPLGDGERFASFTPRENKGLDRTYFQVKLAKSFPLDALPPQEQFVKEFERDDEEEAA